MEPKNARKRVTLRAGSYPSVNLSMPQGWALRGWELALRGAELNQVLLPVGVLLATGGLFFSVGVLMFQRRFSS